MSRSRATRRWVPVLCVMLLLAGVSASVGAPGGTLAFALHFSPVTRWLDPAEGESTITPFLLLLPPRSRASPCRPSKISS